MGIIPNKIRYALCVIGIIVFILSALDIFLVYSSGMSFGYAFIIIISLSAIGVVDEYISVKISKPPSLTAKEREMKKLHEKMITAAAMETDYEKGRRRGWVFIPDKGEYGYSKISLYKTFLILNVKGKQFKLDYKDIDSIRNNRKFACFPNLTAGGVSFFNAVQIKHNANIPKDVYLKGNKKFYNEMKAAAKKNKLKLKFVD